MKTPKKLTNVIGIDLGDRKHAVCITDKNGKILKELTVTNRRDHLEELVDEYPSSLIAMEAGTHSPWISRLLASKGAEVLVANARKLRAIYTNDRKCDRLDAQMLAKLARVDPELLSPIRHGSEQSQQDLLAIKLRDTLVRQRVNIISSIRGSLKALGIRFPTPSSVSYARAARKALRERADILPSIDPCLSVLDGLSAQIREFDKIIKEAGRSRHPQAERLQQIGGIGPITSLCFVLYIECPGRFENAARCRCLSRACSQARPIGRDRQATVHQQSGKPLPAVPTRPIRPIHSRPLRARQRHTAAGSQAGGSGRPGGKEEGGSRYSAQTRSSHAHPLANPERL